MKKRIMKSTALVLGLGLLVCTLIASMVFEARVTDRTRVDMKKLASSIAQQAQLTDGRTPEDAARLSGGAGGVRVTFVDAQGNVTGDSAVQADTMENHATREEILQAAGGGIGVAVRRSATTGLNMMYVAVKLADGTFVRVSDSYPSFAAGLVGFLPAVLIAALVAFLIALVLADRLAKSISGPIEELSDSLKLVKSGGARLDPTAYQYDELQDMAADINQISSEVDTTLGTLTRERSRIDYILDNMDEGLILLGGEQEIILINRAACAFLGCDKAVTGKNIVYATRQMPFLDGVEGAVRHGKTARVELPLSGGALIEAAISPITGPESGAGMAETAIAVLSDITIRRNAVKMRQEFFSNASHELKTPITSIGGFAELLCNSTQLTEAQKEEFARRILKETGRMQNLINDIIMISRLEAGDIVFSREVLDLAEVVRNVAADAKPMAEQRGITMTCMAQQSILSASHREMQELVGNLVQNAVRYSEEGGFVDIELSAGQEGTVLKVHNTGSYIEPRYRERIFERFYRIDKGRSKAMGGTGLGLAIVKHVAGQYHAMVEVQSDPDTGTTFIVTFPPAAPLE